MTDTTKRVDLYNSTYDNFGAEVIRRVREGAFGEDIGQTSWLTADEHRKFFGKLGLGAGDAALDVACGSGGPALFMARTTGCHVTGVDVNEHGVAAANAAARAAALTTRSSFICSDASERLPFADASFDVIVCIDAINHLRDRPRLLRDWLRVLRPGGRALYTNPVVVSGIVSNEEIALRSSIGYFLFAPVGEDERLIRAAGFELLDHEDVTENAALIAKRWHDARSDHREPLTQIEGVERFEGLQQFLAMVHRVSSERRMSRHAFVLRKPA
jgi:SAM-dependent methyltransferase